MPKARQLTVKGTEVAMRIIVTLEEIEGLIDAIDDILRADIPLEDRNFYRGLRKRWIKHEADFRRSLREREASERVAG